jgi:hypothetical protein
MAGASSRELGALLQPDERDASSHRHDGSHQGPQQRRACCSPGQSFAHELHTRAESRGLWKWSPLTLVCQLQEPTLKQAGYQHRATPVWCSNRHPVSKSCAMFVALLM